MKLAVNVEDYDQATYYGKVFDFLKNHIENAYIERKQNDEREYSQSKAQKAREKINEITNKYNQQIKDMEENHKRMLENINYKNQMEIEEFEAKWNKPETLAQYNKPSLRLINLKTIQQNFASAKMFDHAKEVKKQVDELQQQETEEARRRAINDMRLQYDTLLKKHQNSVECFNQYTNKERINIENKREKELIGWNIMLKYNENPGTTTKPRTQVGVTQSIASRPLKKTKIANPTLQLSIGTLSMKNIIKEPKIISPRRKL